MLSSLFARLRAHSAVCATAAPALFLSLFGALPEKAYATEQGLTLASAQQRAVALSRQPLARDYAAAASREQAVAARELPDAVITVGIDSVPVNGPDRYSLTRDFMTQRRIGVMQEFTRSDKRRLRAERFELEAAKSEEEKQSVIATIQRDTALAWLDRYYTEAMAAVIAEQVAEAQRAIDGAESGYRGGRGTQADVLAARSALALAQDRASDMARRVANARLMLARWTRAAPDTPLAGRPEIDTVNLDPATLALQLAQHPQNRMLLREQELASAEASLARADRNPDWSVELAYQQRGSAYSDMVSVAVSVPLQWNRKNRQDRALAAKLATVEQIKADNEEALRSDLAQVRVMMDEWTAKRKRVDRYSRELLPLAQARIEASLAAYRGGKASLADVLSTRREEVDMRLQALQLEAETARLWAQLNFLFQQSGAALAGAQITGGRQ